MCVGWLRVWVCFFWVECWLGFSEFGVECWLSCFSLVEC